ncbi:hypothetical protein NA78x_005244 [Anatilimnocola sp. NA78]|uniref:hypothetical protein n=1 Tax=Anatilimnocola sp. NA78 TaxID=3415683 RepID=UPI003CE4E2F6
MRRWRFSLRSFLLFIVIITAVTSLVAMRVGRGLRAYRSHEWLGAHGVICCVPNSDQMPMSLVWRESAGVCVDVTSADLTAQPECWTHIRNLGALQELWGVSGEEASSREFIECLGLNQATIVSLGVSWAELTPDALRAIGDCKELTRLALIDPPSGVIPFQFTPLPKLEKVWIPSIQNELRDADLVWLAHQPALKEIILWNRDLSPSIVGILCECQELETCNLAGCTIDRPELQKFVVSAKRLKKLVLPKIAFTSTDAEAILQSSLAEIDVQYATLDAAAFEALLRCEHIERLTIKAEMLQDVTLPNDRATALTIVVDQGQLSLAKWRELRDLKRHNITIDWWRFGIEGMDHAPLVE